MKNITFTFSLFISLVTFSENAMELKGGPGRPHSASPQSNYRKTLHSKWRKKYEGWRMETVAHRLMEENRDIKENMQGQNDRIAYLEQETARLNEIASRSLADNKQLQGCNFQLWLDNQRLQSICIQFMYGFGGCHPRQYVDENGQLCQLPEQFWQESPQPDSVKVNLRSAQNDVRHSWGKFKKKR